MYTHNALHALALAGFLSATASGQPLNVIFYGNSFTFGAGSTRSVDSLFRDIAAAAGEESPFVVSAAVSGQDLEWHVANNTARIFSSIPPANDWDLIVMQEHSTKLTRAYPDSPPFPASIEESKTTAVQLHEVAKTRSPGVRPMLYETWARGPGHEFYGGPSPLFSGPDEMQAEIRDGYNSLRDALNDAAGDDLTTIAPVGDAWQEANFDNLHSGDLWHAQNRGTLLAALVIYGTAYGDVSTSDIDLSGVLASLSLTADDGAFLTAAADATLSRGAVPEPTALAMASLALSLAVRRRQRRQPTR
ncbi:hypothetical protein KOR34_14100 [Posidoniimonas corsicana]|uniref:PEP-CTERM protein-sorting domain-containing protein n=1 Tax=Posidoniimonas corsicana TaxID=1938618 RepID=A0A5C5VD02_9BACT|nr:hypothetical protein [Posidoniimonas corsicana]TWT36504.1 hypothetical protein KOR34_14100 [Posidoniimonas corsicana]